LRSEEILEHVDFVVRDRGIADEVILYSAMGEGEPLLAYKRLVPVLQLLARRQKARIAISTSGAKPRLIRALTEEDWQKPLKLQLSLHAPADPMRQELMPGAAKLDETLDAASFYARETHFPVELNYVLLQQKNDRPEDALQLAEIALKRNWLVKINRFNESSSVKLKASTADRKRAFLNVLRLRGVRVEEYETNGADIGAACGQLSYVSQPMVLMRNRLAGSHF